MDLQKTVSEILVRDVTLEEAKEFANEQFGLLTTYLRGRDIQKGIVIHKEDAIVYAKEQYNNGKDNKDFVDYENWN